MGMIQSSKNLSGDKHIETYRTQRVTDPFLRHLSVASRLSARSFPLLRSRHDIPSPARQLGNAVFRQNLTRYVTITDIDDITKSQWANGVNLFADILASAEDYLAL